MRYEMEIAQRDVSSGCEDYSSWDLVQLRIEWQFG